MTGSKIQLLDLPGIIEGAKDGKGRGKQVIAGFKFKLLVATMLLKQISIRIVYLFF